VSDEAPGPALSFGGVAEAYDRARPSYPVDAVSWLVGTGLSTVVELGAGTGKLTELLVDAGHDVIATDPLPTMLTHLRKRVPDARVAVADAEHIPVPSRSTDVVVCAQSFHWFDHRVALPEIARVLRPGGVLALVWNARDEGIPWVRKLGAIIGSPENDTDLAGPAVASEHFGLVEEREFRFWQTLRRDDLFDLVRSRSSVTLLDPAERDDLLDRVGALYDGYGRGPDGMQLPYLTRCYRTVVRHQDPPPTDAGVHSGVHSGAHTDGAGTPELGRVPLQAGPPEDPGTLLFDFR
jgi:SAM-dependent methyltransferase